MSEVTCPNCVGEPAVNKQPCQYCNGTGKVTKEKMMEFYGIDLKPEGPAAKKLRKQATQSEPILATPVVEAEPEPKIETALEPAGANNLQTVVVGPTNPLDLPVEVFAAALDRRGTNRRALMKWVKDAMVRDVDYGKLKIKTKSGGTRDSKDSLFKPGAEKLCGMLGLTAVFPNMADYEQAALNGIALEHIVIRCHLIDSHGNKIGEGVGARSLKQEYGDLNKALKMASKSAQIDATLRAAGLSEVFTQDIEDIAKPEPETTHVNEQDLPEQYPNSGPPASSAGTCMVCHWPIERFSTDKGRNFLACSIWYRARIGDEDGKKWLDAFEEKNPNEAGKKHTWRWEVEK